MTKVNSPAKEIDARPRMRILPTKAHELSVVVLLHIQTPTSTFHRPHRYRTTACAAFGRALRRLVGGGGNS